MCYNDQINTNSNAARASSTYVTRYSIYGLGRTRKTRKTRFFGLRKEGTRKWTRVRPRGCPMSNYHVDEYVWLHDCGISVLIWLMKYSQLVEIKVHKLSEEKSVPVLGPWQSTNQEVVVGLVG